MQPVLLDTVKVDGLTVAYREAGAGPPVLLIHGWPTSSFLWRAQIPRIAERNRVVAIDLPGFGASDKPLATRYGFELYDRTLDGLLEALAIDTVSLAVHDLGGPVGVHWAINRPERVAKLALLNTLVYPELSPAVLEFVKNATTPGLREKLTSPEGLEEAMRLGLADEAKLTADLLEGIQEPFRSDEARRALADAGVGLELEGFAEISEQIGALRMPVRIVYGERDRLLPDVAETMARVKRDVRHAEVTALADCGHFLQEDAPEEVGDLLAEFFAEPA